MYDMIVCFFNQNYFVALQYIGKWSERINFVTRIRCTESKPKEDSQELFLQ